MGTIIQIVLLTISCVLCMVVYNMSNKALKSAKDRFKIISGTDYDEYEKQNKKK